MKINEIASIDYRALFESLDRNNDTGFATADLVNIVKTHRASQWDECSLEEELSRLDKLAESDNAGK